MTHRAFISVPLLTCAFVGCDMGDYQSRVDRNRVRLKVFDEEEKHLGNPLAVARVYDKAQELTVDAWPMDIFLRLPRGVRPDLPAEGGAIDCRDFYLFKYAGDSVSVYVAATELGNESDKPDASGRASTPDEFRNRVKAGLRKELANEPGVFANVRWEGKEKMVRTNIETTGIGGGKGSILSFDVFQGEAIPTVKDRDGYTLVAYYHQAPADKQLVIIYQYPHGRADVKAIEMSVRTLGLFGEAASRRADYDRLHPKK